MQIDVAQTAEDHRLVDFFRRHWLDMGVREQDIAPDWHARALAFISSARMHQAFAGFIAHLHGEPVGGACCQMADRVYPAFLSTDPLLVGYVWGVYVTPAHRGHGIGATLVQSCTDYLASQGCERVLLHAGQKSRPLYSRLGFQPTDELMLVTVPRRDDGLRG